MKRARILSVLLMATFVLTLPVLAQDDGSSTVPSTIKPSTLSQRFQWRLNGGVAAAGVGMRNLGYGTITISGVPAGATVVQAFLYWDILDNEPQAAFADGYFEETAITGTMLGSGTTPCWSPPMNFAYRADVTSLVTGDGAYSLRGFASGRSDGLDPWSGTYPPLNEGASLIVIYKCTTSPYVSITINDADPTNNALVGQSDTTNFSGLNAAGTGAKITYVIADGQDAGEPNTMFNGNPLGINLWGGSDPIAVGGTYSHGNLWDTKTFDVSAFVTAGDTTATTTVDSGPDCLVWIAAVLAVVEPAPGPIPVFSNAILMLPIALIAGVGLVRRRRQPN